MKPSDPMDVVRRIHAHSPSQTVGATFATLAKREELHEYDQHNPPINREVTDGAFPPEADAAFEEAVFHRTAYLAGPMRGYPEHNREAFTKATADLRSRGWKILSPFERDLNDPNVDIESDDFKAGVEVNPLKYYMQFDLAMVCQSDAIICLPGWEDSEGANLEVDVARRLHIPVLAYGDELAEIPTLQAPAIFGDYEPIRVGDIAPADTVTNEVIDSHAVDVLLEELHAERKPWSVGPEIRIPVVVKRDWSFDSTSKATNPKDAVGSDKLPLHLWPETATVMGCLGMLDGMLKYGRSNWRVAGVRASIYIDAVRRHINAYAEGEDLDPDSGMPHLAHALACLAILVDAGAAGMLTDDRQVAGGYRQLVDSLTPLVAQLKAKHAGKDPYHYTIADNRTQAEYERSVTR